MLYGNPSGLIERAYKFAASAHAAVGQRRKYTGEPYITHPIAVAAKVATVRHTEAMLAASLLHDTVEDTDTTIAAVQDAFGLEVAELVGWLTDVSHANDGNRAHRKALDRAHIANAPAAAKTIKLADLIDNTTSIVAHDPAFAAVYLREKIALLEVLKEGDPTLWQQARTLALNGLSRLADLEICTKY